MKDQGRGVAYPELCVVCAARDSNHAQSAFAQRQNGFTLIELLITLAIIWTLAAIAIPNLVAARDYAKSARAVADIHTIADEIQGYQIVHGKYPDMLADIGYGATLDPWGSPYQYLNFADTNGKGKMRKDRFLVPINTFFDLYSMGKDGQSVPPLTAKASQDDIIWANDGSYIGLASDF
jgi:general secretion pathway protein G